MSINLSFEFFPPKTENGQTNLAQTRQQLAQLKPEFFSITFGAGGSTRDLTYDLVIDTQAQTKIETAPHLSCIASTKNNVANIIQRYQQQNIRRIVALRGDIPSGTVEMGEFRYANELVSFIREQTGEHFHIEVAVYPEAHPQAPNLQSDLKNFKRKVDAGANSAITQYFFNPDAYFRLLDDCQKLGIDIPIIPGIMPITNYTQLSRFSDICGAEIPRWIRRRLEGYGDDMQSIQQFGLEVVTQLCQTLRQQGTTGLHFYTMNKTEPTITICRQLDVVLF